MESSERLWRLARERANDVSGTPRGRSYLGTSRTLMGQWASFSDGGEGHIVFLPKQAHAWWCRAKRLAVTGWGWGWGSGGRAQIGWRSFEVNGIGLLGRRKVWTAGTCDCWYSCTEAVSLTLSWEKRKPGLEPILSWSRIVIWLIDSFLQISFHSTQGFACEWLPPSVSSEVSAETSPPESETLKSPQVRSGSHKQNFRGPNSHCRELRDLNSFLAMSHELCSPRTNKSHLFIPFLKSWVWRARLAQSMEHGAVDFGVMSSSPTLGCRPDLKGKKKKSYVCL